MVVLLYSYIDHMQIDYHWYQCWQFLKKKKYNSYLFGGIVSVSEIMHAYLGFVNFFTISYFYHNDY